MLTNNIPENILHTAFETKMISTGDNLKRILYKQQIRRRNNLRRIFYLVVSFFLYKSN